MKIQRRTVKYSQGFTLMEVMVATAIIGILAAIAVPNFIGYRPKQSLKRAINEYHGLLQQAKMTAIKTRQDCIIDFPSSTSYRIACPSFNRTIDLSDYGGGVDFVNPSGGGAQPPSFSFTSTGMVRIPPPPNPPPSFVQGYVYFSNQQRREFYRIGPLISGVIVRAFWDGNAWQSL